MRFSVRPPAAGQVFPPFWRRGQGRVTLISVARILFNPLMDSPCCPYPLSWFPESGGFCPGPIFKHPAGGCLSTLLLLTQDHPEGPSLS